MTDENHPHANRFPETLHEALARVEALARELAATQRAKAENDDRFMTERGTCSARSRGRSGSAAPRRARSWRNSRSGPASCSTASARCRR